MDVRVGAVLERGHLPGCNPLIFGVHFRYGAGIYVDSTGTLMITATERNSVAGSPVAVNEWK